MFRTIFFSAILICLPALAVDPSMLGLVMPEATAVAGADFDKVQATPFGVYLLNQIKAQEPQLAMLSAMSGFDPRRDVREVLVASTMPAIDPTQAGTRLNTLSPLMNSLIILRGTFDPGKLSTLVTSQGGTASSYKGVTVLANKQAREWAAFPQANLLVAGTPDSVKAAIDRFQASAKLDAGLSDRIQAASNRFDGWMVSNAMPVPPAAAPAPAAAFLALLQAVESTTNGVKFGPNVVFTIEALTRSEKDASALVDLAQFVLTMASGKEKAIQTLLQSLQPSVEGRTARFVVSIPETEIEKLIQPAKRVARQQ